MNIDMTALAEREKIKRRAAALGPKGTVLDVAEVVKEKIGVWVWVLFDRC